MITLAIAIWLVPFLLTIIMFMYHWETKGYDTTQVIPDEAIIGLTIIPIFNIPMAIYVFFILFK
jgi:hypothetical protein